MWKTWQRQRGNSNTEVHAKVYGGKGAQKKSEKNISRTCHNILKGVQELAWAEKISSGWRKTEMTWRGGKKNRKEEDVGEWGDQWGNTGAKCTWRLWEEELVCLGKAERVGQKILSSVHFPARRLKPGLRSQNLSESCVETTDHQ